MASAARCSRLCSASLGSASNLMPDCGWEVASVTSGEPAGAGSLNWLIDLSVTCGAEAQAHGWHVRVWLDTLGLCRVQRPESL